MNEKSILKRKISELDFAIYELVLYLDTHPTSKKGMTLLNKYRRLRDELIHKYEDSYGDYVLTFNDAKDEDYWHWLDDPWPWENDFSEE